MHWTLLRVCDEKELRWDGVGSCGPSAETEKEGATHRLEEPDCIHELKAAYYSRQHDFTHL